MEAKSIFWTRRLDNEARMKACSAGRIDEYPVVPPAIIGNEDGKYFSLVHMVDSSAQKGS
jgi:hypothetical protein